MAVDSRAIRAAVMKPVTRPLVMSVLYLAATALLLMGADVPAPASYAASASSPQGLDSPAQPYSEAADTQGGWIFVSGVLRTSSKAPASGGEDSALQRSKRMQPWLTSHDINALNARPHLRIAKCGDNGSSTTTIPPPSV